MIASATLVIAALGLAVWIILVLRFVASWRRLSLAERQSYRNDLLDRSEVLAALGGLVVLPGAAAGFAWLLGIFELPAYWVVPPAALAWAILAVWFWEQHARPWSALARTLPVAHMEQRRLVIPAEPILPGPLLNPRPAPSPSLFPVPQLQDEDAELRTLKWIYQHIEQTIDLPVSPQRFEILHLEPRLPVQEWAKYATAEHPEVEILAIQFMNLHLDKDWCTYNQAGNVLSCVQQCISYAHDKETTPQPDWPRYPLETLVEGIGDCEDMAILAAAVLRRMGFSVALLVYSHHVALGIAGAEGLPGVYVRDPSTGRQYFYGEATADGWRIGEAPQEFQGIAPDYFLPVEILVQSEKSDQAKQPHRGG
jgi:hypothetical protein